MDKDIEQTFDLKIKKMKKTIDQRITTLNDYFNQLKDDLYAITKDYENTKSEDREITDRSTYALIEEQMTELLQEERDKNIDFINEEMSQFDHAQINQTEDNNNPHNLNDEILGEINQVNEAIDFIKETRHNTLETMSQEMNNEFNSIAHLVCL